MVGGVEEPEALAAYLERVWTLAEVTAGVVPRGSPGAGPQGPGLGLPGAVIRGPGLLGEGWGPSPLTRGRQAVAEAKGVKDGRGHRRLDPHAPGEVAPGQALPSYRKETP